MCFFILEKVEMIRKEKDKYPEIYGYKSPEDIPKNEDGSETYYLSFVDADREIRYAAVSKELFIWSRNYERNIRRKRDIETRCFVPSTRTHLKRCLEDCSNCPYGYTTRQNFVSSIDYLYDNYEMEYPSDEPTPEEVYRQSELMKALHNSLNKLSPTQRRIIELSYFEGLSDAEIGKIIGMKRSTVQIRRSYALEELRNMLKAYV
ncbi:MAG: sigma-70 family RNA polymerase sigma factor [Bacilli bacterium]|nr:sigma-70 family RNA polymerase sigma factor [Bacilli bacterium]